MSQPHYVMSFRKRLIKRGYSLVSIRKHYPYSDCWTVSAVEPLGGKRVLVDCSVVRLTNDFRF